MSRWTQPRNCRWSFTCDLQEKLHFVVNIFDTSPADLRKNRKYLILTRIRAYYLMKIKTTFQPHSFPSIRRIEKERFYETKLILKKNLLSFLFLLFYKHFSVSITNKFMDFLIMTKSILLKKILNLRNVHHVTCCLSHVFATNVCNIFFERNSINWNWLIQNKLKVLRNQERGFGQLIQLTIR